MNLSVVCTSPVLLTTQQVNAKFASGELFFGHVQAAPNWYECADVKNIVTVAPQYPGVEEIDPVLAAGAIGAGFFTLLPLWAVVWGLRKLLDAIH